MSALGLPATASAHICSSHQPARVRVFERNGVFRACLRGYPSHVLGLVKPDQRRVQGTMLAYTVRIKGDDFIAALDLADGSRWLRGRQADGLVVRMRLRRVGALIWTTDTGGVFVASIDPKAWYSRPDGTKLTVEHGAAQADRLDAPATGLRITKHLVQGDPCGAEYAYGFHWRAGDVARKVVWDEFEGYGCG